MSYKSENKYVDEMFAYNSSVNFLTLLFFILCSYVEI